MDEKERMQKINEALEKFTFREREIIKLRYVKNVGGDFRYTLEEVGRKFKCTRERIRQIEGKALAKLSADIQNEIKRRT